MLFNASGSRCRAYGAFPVVVAQWNAECDASLRWTNELESRNLCPIEFYTRSFKPPRVFVFSVSQR